MKPTDLTRISPDEQELGGWISPEGLFFQAYYGEHNIVARNIVRDFLYSSHVNGYHDDYLVKLGWIRLETTGDIHHPFTPTGQQENILYWCYTRAVTGWYKQWLYEAITQIVEGAVCVREPMPRVPAQGDQENYHHRDFYRPIPFLETRW